MLDITVVQPSYYSVGEATNKTPNGKILKDMGKSTGTASVNVEPKEKHMRTAFSVELLYNYPQGAMSWRKYEN